MILQFNHKGLSRVALDIYANSGELLQTRMLSRYNEKDVKWLAEITQWSIPQTNQTIQQFCDGEEPEEVHDFEPPPGLADTWETEKPVPVTQTPFVLHVRELTQLKKHSKTFSHLDTATALEEALKDVTKWKEPIIEWVDQDKLCCLDIDYHSATPPPFAELYRIAASLRPQPFAWHTSHGGGLKLYYVEHPGFTATELASVAGMQWMLADPKATFDLIKSSRHPCFPRSRDDKAAPCSTPDDIYFPRGSGDVSSLKRYLNSEADPEDVERLLTERGWNIGQTLQHRYCPLEPDGNPKECVFIGDQGVYCHHCKAKGVGGKNAGFLSYASMIQGSDSRIRTMVRNFVHLEQARIILENLFPTIPPSVLGDIYRVLLKILHNPNDPRIYRAMVAGKGVVRIKGQWVTSDGNTSLTEGITQFVRSLPAILVPTDEGLTPDTSKWFAFINSGDLSEFGYYDVSFIRGTKIYGVYNPYPHHEIVKTVCRPEFDGCRPQYLPPSRRMKVESAWELLEQEFPGINRTYVTLLIASKGASEGRLAQCPFLMITGVSSAGKSTTVHVAAGICGDKADEPIFYPDVLRFRGSLMDAARSAGFVCVNEVFKMSDRAKMSPVQALDPMLSLTEDSRSHVLYVGSVPFGRLPVFVLTDITCPAEIMQDYQLARRFTFFRLDSSINWTDTLVERNIRPHEFRLISSEHAQAADTILSDIIDEHFREPVPLSVIATRLGIGGAASNLPEEGLDEREELKTTLRRFYAAIVAAPVMTGSDEKRYASRKGWRKIDRATQGEPLELWGSLADAQSGHGWCVSRVCEAEDWQKLLGLPFPVRIDINNYQGRVLYVRFRSADSCRSPGWIAGATT